MKARTGFGSLVASEWIKLWSLRSTWWCFAILVVAQAGLAFLFAEAGGFRGGVDQNGQAQPLPQAAVQQIAVQFVTQPDTLSVLVLGVLGALAMSGEYSSGMIRSTFAAAPKRIGALLAKLFTFMVSTALVAIVAVGLASAVTMPVALSANPAFDPSDGTYWGALGYEVLYLVLVGGLAIAFGAIITVPAGAISVVLGILLVLPIIASVLTIFLDYGFAGSVQQLIPTGLGREMTAVGDSAVNSWESPSWDQPDIPHVITLNPQLATAALAVYVVVVAAVAGLVTRRRDV